MTIRLDKKVVVKQDDESSDEQLDSEDEFELVSDEDEEKMVTNDGEETDNLENTDTPNTQLLLDKDEVDDDDDDDDGDENSSINSDNGDANANTAWADSIAKILKTNKPKKKRTLVLSKAKKLTDPVKQKVKPAGFQVATADGDVKEEQIIVETKTTEIEEPQRKKKRDILNVRVKPNILHKDRERLLSKIATKGVVQLFNAVKGQQKDISAKLKKAGKLEVRRDKVLKNIDKRAFLDVLAGGDKAESVTVKAPVEKKDKKKKMNKRKEAGTNSTWNVLRDDFMMGAKMKDWDKELDDEGEVEEMMESE